MEGSAVSPQEGLLGSMRARLRVCGPWGRTLEDRTEVLRKDRRELRGMGRGLPGTHSRGHIWEDRGMHGHHGGITVTWTG